MRKRLWKIWQTFLVLSVPGSIVSLLFMACFLDGNSLIPAIVMGINLAWLLLLMIANNGHEEKRSKEKENDDEISVA